MCAAMGYKAAKRGIAKFLHDVVDKIWYNNVKDMETFYTKVTALEIMAHLDANSRGLHAIDIISLRSNMTQYYVQADGIPQFIVMMEDAPKKAKRAGMPIADVELVMMALAAVLAAQHFLQEVEDWEGLPAINRRWRAWKVAFCLAHLKRQHQLQASGVGGPLDSPHAVTPAPATAGDSPQQLGPCSGQQHHSSPAIDGIKLGSFLFGHHAQCSQQKTCGGACQSKTNQPPGSNAGSSLLGNRKCPSITSCPSKI
jgi:hypothetical protein